MPNRLLAILLLALQPTLATAAHLASCDDRDGSPTDAVAMAEGCCCCDVGTKPVEIRSTRCGCEMDAPSRPTDTPAPFTPVNQLTAMSIALAIVTPAVFSEPTDTPCVIAGEFAAVDSCPTHNETRALLCIWRT